MLQNKYYVYALIDPINSLPFYIGKGCNNRAWQHLKDNETCNKKKLNYIALANRIRFPMSEEQKLKLSICNKGKVLNDETKIKISNTLKENSFNIEKTVLLELRKNHTISEIAKMYNLSISPIKR